MAGANSDPWLFAHGLQNSSCILTKFLQFSSVIAPMSLTNPVASVFKYFLSMHPSSSPNSRVGEKIKNRWQWWPLRDTCRSWGFRWGVFAFLRIVVLLLRKLATQLTIFPSIPFLLRSWMSLGWETMRFPPTAA